MFDHVTITVSNVPASKQFYSTVLGVLGMEPSFSDDDAMGWDDWWIGSMDDRHELTQGLHVGFRARDRGQVDEFWWTALDFGYREEGAPGQLTQYDPTYYSAFLLDPDGNSVQAVYREREPAVPVGCIDHLWIRVRDVHASQAFYMATARQTGLRLTPHDPARLQLSGDDYSLWLVRDERRLTENVHIAFTASDDDSVRGFHAAAMAAGYEDNGAPGERHRYHPGYYAAYVLDPDGHNIEVVNHNHVPGGDLAEVAPSAPERQPIEGGGPDQVIATDALKRLEQLIGEWELQAVAANGEPFAGSARASIAWHDSGSHLIQRVTVDMPEAPNVVAIMGCDAANGTYYQLYSDDRGVCRVYEMSLRDDGEWKLWRVGEPFSQRFTAHFEDDGNTIIGRWEKAPDGSRYETDFDLIYKKVG